MPVRVRSCPFVPVRARSLISDTDITIPSLVGTVQLRCPFAMIWFRVQHFEYSQSQAAIFAVFLVLFRLLVTLLTFETLKWEYTFTTDALIAIHDESPLVRSGGAGGIGGFGT